MTVPRVSVVTPVYNGADYIAACIASVAASVTCGRIAVEHIIIDDGSTDGTVAAINRAGAALPPPRSYEGRLVRLSDNSGKPAYGRNRGIEAAKGKYIFCLDHDDILLQNTLRYLASHLETNASEIAYGDFLRCDSAMVYEIGRDYYGWHHPNGRAALYSIFKGDHFYQHSFMFTKRLWHQVGGYDEALTYGETSSCFGPLRTSRKRGSWAGGEKARADTRLQPTTRRHHSLRWRRQARASPKALPLDGWGEWVIL